MLHIKIETFSLDAIKTRLRDEFNTSYAISAFEFQICFTHCPVLSMGATEPSNLRKSSHASISPVKSD